MLLFNKIKSYLLILNIYLLVTAAKNKTLGFFATFFKKIKIKWFMHSFLLSFNFNFSYDSFYGDDSENFRSFIK
jgi:RsiW-degrading membrane proteinase PrsW (M82 family)